MQLMNAIAQVIRLVGSWRAKDKGSDGQKRKQVSSLHGCSVS